VISTSAENAAGDERLAAATVKIHDAFQNYERARQKQFQTNFDIVCFYADLGIDYYVPLLEKLTASARAVMPGVRLVLLSPSKVPGFDVTVPMPKAGEADICYRRAEALASWGSYSPRASVFVDADLEFRSFPQFGDWDIGLMWRRNPAQPINSGMILARPQQKEFWASYLRIAYSLPKPFRAWWGDQLPFSLMTGVFNKPGDEMDIGGSKIKLLEMDRLCPKSDRPHPEAWALHYKGTRRKKSGDGTFSPESVTSTATDTEPS